MQRVLAGRGLYGEPWRDPCCFAQTNACDDVMRGTLFEIPVALLRARKRGTRISGDR
jgi:hypothetical protein